MARSSCHQRFGVITIKGADGGPDTQMLVCDEESQILEVRKARCSPRRCTLTATRPRRRARKLVRIHTEGKEYDTVGTLEKLGKQRGPCSLKLENRRDRCNRGVTGFPTVMGL